MTRNLGRFGLVFVSDPCLFQDQLERYSFHQHSSRARRIHSWILGDAHYAVDPAGGYGRVSNKNAVSAPDFRGVRGSSLPARLNPWRLRKIALGFSITIEATDPRYDDYHWIGVRDQLSLNSLQKRGLRATGYFPDWAFFDELAISHQFPKSGFAASFRAKTPDCAQEISPAALVPWLLQAQQYWAHTAIFHQVDEDFEFSEKLAANLSNKTLRSNRLASDTYRSFYRGKRAVLSNRLHCLLFGAMNGALPIALVHSAHSKIVSLFETLGWNDLLVLVDQHSPERIASIAARQTNLSQMVALHCAEQHQLGEKLLGDQFGLPMKR